MSGLLPCPFCGEPPRCGTFHTESLFSHDQVEWLSISCTECDCALVEGEDHAEVRERWNRRPSAHDTTERQPEPRETVTPSITKELTGQGVEGGDSEVADGGELIDFISDSMSNAADYDMGWRDYAKRVAADLLAAHAVRFS